MTSQSAPPDEFVKVYRTGCDSETCCGDEEIGIVWRSGLAGRVWRAAFAAGAKAGRDDFIKERDKFIEDNPELCSCDFTDGYKRGAAAQAEKDARIADQYAESMKGDMATHLAYQASATIAAAIRAASADGERGK